MQSFNRPNLKYALEIKKKSITQDIISKIQQDFDGQSGIVYCLSRLVAHVIKVGCGQSITVKHRLLHNEVITIHV
jgi:superfamily II DNA helicase RecQ